jgi:hypothetical protein
MPREVKGTAVRTGGNICVREAINGQKEKRIFEVKMCTYRTYSKPSVNSRVLSE